MRFYRSVVCCSVVVGANDVFDNSIKNRKIFTLHLWRRANKKQTVFQHYTPESTAREEKAQQWNHLCAVWVGGREKERRCSPLHENVSKITIWTVFDRFSCLYYVTHRSNPSFHILVVWLAHISTNIKEPTKKNEDDKKSMNEISNYAAPSPTVTDDVKILFKQSSCHYESRYFLFRALCCLCHENFIFWRTKVYHKMNFVFCPPPVSFEKRKKILIRRRNSRRYYHLSADMILERWFIFDQHGNYLGGSLKIIDVISLKIIK